MWPDYNIKKDQDKYVICKNDKPLLLPCKLIKLKQVEFDTEEEAKAYIDDVNQLIKNNQDYVERF